MDMHRALSQPFEKPPWEVIAHRVHKDIQRYRLMYEEYGVPYDKKLAEQFSIGADAAHVENANINVTTLAWQMLGGYQCYTIMLEALRAITSEKSAFHTTLMDMGILDSIQKLIDKCADAQFSAKDGKLSFTAPSDDKQIGIAHKRVNIVSDDFITLANVLAGTGAKKLPLKYYNMYGDVLRPRAIVVGPISGTERVWELYDNYGRMQPCFDLSETSKYLHKINTDFSEISIDADNSVFISGPQNILLYALQKYHDYGTPDKERAYHLYMYQSTIWLIEAAEKVINALRNASGVDQKGLNDLYKVLPFFLTTRAYGKENWSADYLSLIYYKTYLMRGVPSAEHRKTRPTYAYYPDHPHGEKKFDIRKSPIFQMDGASTPGPFEPTSMDPDHM
jgi:hypothetical protein